MAKPEYFHELNKNVEILTNSAGALEKKADGLDRKVETQNEKLQEVTKDVAILKQQVADQTKRIEEWDRRLWGSWFCQLFKYRPETLFELLGEPSVRARSYRFDSVELKKSFRIDGLFLPHRHTMPLYFVEVQFHRLERFYANLFAKVFSYLNENRPGQEWRAVAIFPSRREEPRRHKPYDDLLESPRFKRFYLDELVLPPDPPLGLGIMRLVSAPEENWPAR